MLHAEFGTAMAPAAPSGARRALVLMGGGARTAYQVGVLRGVASLLRMMSPVQRGFPFDIVVGTSAGALNGTFLASCATEGIDAFERLAQFWTQLRSDHVYELGESALLNWAGRFSRVLGAWHLGRNVRAHGAVLNSMPLVDTLHRAISLEGVDTALERGALRALAVTASSYTSGVHWTFCHTAQEGIATPWNRPGRRAELQPVTIEHLMASSAIPFLFPPAALWVDGRREWFGDGSMRQISPLSPALHLGASHVLVIGVGHPQRSGLGVAPGASGARQPTLGGIAAHAMASVFHDTVHADVELAQRVSTTLRQLPREVAQVLPLRGVHIVSVQPTQMLDDLAREHMGELPRGTRNALSALGSPRGSGAGLASYLLFEPGFVQALMALGEQDAFAQKDAIKAFLAD